MSEDYDLLQSDEAIQKCYKVENSIIGLNINHNFRGNSIVLWNKYQVFLYENIDFIRPPTNIIPEFILNQAIIFVNYLVCLDSTGNIHILSLKFKNSVQKKRIKTGFLPRLQNILISCPYIEDHIISLKFESGQFYICTNKVNNDFKLEQKIMLVFNKDIKAPEKTDKCILRTIALGEQDFSVMKKYFKVPENIYCKNCSLVIIALDKINVFGLLLCTSMIIDEMEVIKLYASPSEICDIQVLSGETISLHIGLVSGTIIKLNLLNPSETPETSHLNTALYRFISIEDTILYTDGLEMWRANKIYSQHEINFNQYFVANVKDFTISGDNVICTTSLNFIYIFTQDNKKVFKHQSSTVKEYCRAEDILNNPVPINKIFAEIDTNYQIEQKIKEEENCVTLVSLSHRKDVMKCVINMAATVYQTYDEASKEAVYFTLTECLVEYFENNPIIFMINIVIIDSHQYSDVLSFLHRKTKIIITISSKHSILKVTSLRLRDSLKSMKLLIPLKKKNVNTTAININMKVVTSIPGIHDKEKQKWINLYETDVTMNSEHFITTKAITRQQINLDNEEPLSELIFSSLCHHFGNLFKITDVNKLKTQSLDWSHYVKLPSNYRETFQDPESYKRHLSTKVATYLYEQCHSEEFLKSNYCLFFEIFNSKVKIEVVNDDFSTPLLKVSSDVLQISNNIRNFFAKLLYQKYVNIETGKEFVNYAFYTSVENLKKSLNNMPITVSSEEFHQKIDDFQRTIYGTLPV